MHAWNDSDWLPRILTNKHQKIARRLPDPSPRERGWGLGTKTRVFPSIMHTHNPLIVLAVFFFLCSFPCVPSCHYRGYIEQKLLCSCILIVYVCRLCSCLEWIWWTGAFRLSPSSCSCNIGKRISSSILFTTCSIIIIIILLLSIEVVAGYMTVYIYCNNKSPHSSRHTKHHFCSSVQAHRL